MNMKLSTPTPTIPSKIGNLQKLKTRKLVMTSNKRTELDSKCENC